MKWIISFVLFKGTDLTTLEQNCLTSYTNPLESRFQSLDVFLNENLSNFQLTSKSFQTILPK